MKLERPVEIDHAHGGAPRRDTFETLEALAVFMDRVGSGHAASRQAYRDAKVMLGHVLMRIDEQIPYHQRGTLYEQIRIHPKTAQHAKRLADRIADPYGRIDFDKVRALQISRAEGHAEGVPMTRQERAILEAAAETLTGTGLEYLAGVRSLDDRGSEQSNRLLVLTPGTATGAATRATTGAPAAAPAAATPSRATPSAAGGGVDGPASAAGTPAPAVTLSPATAGASGAQLSFDWEVTQDRAYTIADWIWQRADELNEQRRRRVDELLAQVIGVWGEAEHERSTRMSAKAHEIGDLMETGRSRYRTG